MWDLKQRNFFCVRLRPHSLWTQAGKRSTLGCGCRDSLYTGLGAALLSLPMSLSSGSRHRGGERVTYLDLLNSFHQWQKSNYLPGNARLLYYGLLAVFNEARWPEQVQIDNFRLMSMLDTRTERVAIAARDSLVAAGLIEYSRGKKRSRLPNCTAHSETTLQNWAADFDKCHRLDGHSWEGIDKVLQFSQFDSFWQSNILSGGKFRKQYTQLLAKMGGGGT